MDGLDFIISHTSAWIDIKSILALIFLVAVIVFFIVRYRKMRKIEKGLEDEMKAAGIEPDASNPDGLKA